MASLTRASVLLPGVSRWPAPLRRVTTLLAALYLAFIFVVAVFADRVAPYSFSAQDTSKRLQAPSPQHLLGTDDFGRDVFSRLVHGARVSLAVAVGVEIVELLFGLSLGMLAGLKGGRLDNLVMLLALALVGWPGMVRLVRSQVLGLREREFVDAARTMGASDGRIMRKHLLPNVLGPVVVAATVGMGAIVLAESTLSFLGLGIQEPYPSWGSMINQAWKLRRTDPMLTVYPALCLAFTIMAFNFLGDGLRDWLDPRSRAAA